MAVCNGARGGDPEIEDAPRTDARTAFEGGNPSSMSELEHPAMIENPGPTARLRAKVLAGTVAAMLSGATVFGASVAVAADAAPSSGARGT